MLGVYKAFLSMDQDSRKRFRESAEGKQAQSEQAKRWKHGDYTKILEDIKNSVVSPEGFIIRKKFTFEVVKKYIYELLDCLQALEEYSKDENNPIEWFDGGAREMIPKLLHKTELYHDSIEKGRIEDKETFGFSFLFFLNDSIAPFIYSLDNMSKEYVERVFKREIPMDDINKRDGKAAEYRDDVFARYSYETETLNLMVQDIREREFSVIKEYGPEAALTLLKSLKTLKEISKWFPQWFNTGISQTMVDCLDYAREHGDTVKMDMISGKNSKKNQIDIENFVSINVYRLVSLFLQVRPTGFYDRYPELKTATLVPQEVTSDAHNVKALVKPLILHLDKRQ